MGQFGAFQVNRACRHAFGHLEMELEPGRYEPTSNEEFEAMAHLASVPVAAAEDDTPGEPFAVKLEDPSADPAPETGGVQPPAADPPLPEPPPAAEPANPNEE